MHKKTNGNYITKDNQFGRDFSIYNTDYYRENERLYESDHIFFAENSITCLVGCNGLGKSTILRQLMTDHDNSLDHTAWNLEDSHTISFRNLFNDDRRENYDEFFLFADKDTRYGGSEDDFICHNLIGMSLSTGEKVLNNFGPVFNILGKETNLLLDKRIFILLDDLDVGVSIDVLREIADTIKLVEKTLKSRGIKYYIILTANSYELAKNFNCMDVITMEPVKFKDYEEYGDYVCKTAEYKQNRMKE